MNNSPLQPDPESNPPPSRISRFLNWLKRPSTLIGTGTVVGIIVGGSLISYSVIRRQLPTFLESQITNFLDRPVNLGELKTFSFSEIEMGFSEIPATASDQDNLSVQAIKIEYDLGSLLTQWKLPIRLTIINPEIYLDQNEEGVWLALEPIEEKPKLPELPFDLEANATIEDAEIVLLPQALNSPVEITSQLEGVLNYPREGEAELSYDIEANFADAPIQIQGKTNLDNLGTQANIAIAQLSLVKLSSLVAPLSVRLTQGELNANLTLNIPSLEAYQDSQVQGNLEIKQVTGNLAISEDKRTSFASNIGLNFQDQEVNFTQGDIKLGEIAVNLSGKANLKQGYDLDVSVSPFTIKNVLAVTPDIELPIKTAGEFQLALNILGAIDNPELKAVFTSTKPTEIDQIKLDETNVILNATLDQIILDRAEIIPETGGTIVATGNIQTDLTETLQGRKAINPATMPVNLDAIIDLPLDELASIYTTLPTETRLGSFNSKIQFQGTVEDPDFRANWQLIDTFIITVGEIVGEGEATFDGTQFLLDNTGFQTELGDISIFGQGNLETKNWEAIINSNQVALDPIISELIGQGKLEESITALNIDIRAGGSLEATNIEDTVGKADVTVAVGGTAIDFQGNLEQGNLQTFFSGQRLNLVPLISPFFPQLNVALEVNRLQGELGGNITSLFQEDFDLVTALDALAGQVNTVVAIDESLVNFNANLRKGGQLEANFFSDSAFAMTPFIPNLPTEAIFENGTASVSGTIAQLATLLKTQDVGGLTAQTNLNFSIADGAIALQGNLQNGIWEANLLVSEVETTPITRPYLVNLTPETTAFTFPPLNADLAISGEANPLLQNAPASVDLNRANVEWGKQSLQARGNLILAPLFTAPDIAEAQFEVETNLDFNTLPTAEILDLIPIERQYLPQSLEIAGESRFRGQIRGQQLLQAPTAPNSIIVEGDINLTNFQFNDLIFDPMMAGTVNFATGNDLQIALRGDNDAIIAAVSPCLETACVAPYRLDTLELRQQEAPNEPILVLATGQDNQIAASIENFPLSIFRIAPTQELGFPGTVGGIVNAQASLDLGTVTAKGEAEIAKPGVGTTEADELAIAFAYENNEATLSQGRLLIGENRFNFEGNYNVTSREIGGNLTLLDGNIQDILAALNLPSVRDIARFAQTQDQGNAADLGAIALTPQDNSLSSSLALYRHTVKEVQATAASRRSQLPNQLNLRGKLELEANLNGTVDNPDLNLSISGEDWEARPRESVPTVNPTLGFIIEDAGILRINDLTIAANYQEGVGELEEASLTLGRGKITASGEFDPNRISGNAEIDDLPLDTILEFVPSPVDASGAIALNLAVSGTPQNPEVQGDFSFTNGSFQGQAIAENFIGEFSYSNSQFALQTTNPSDIDIQINGNIALPPQPNFENTFTANADIGESGFALLSAFSLGQIEWVEGQGKMVIAAETAYTDDPRAAIDNLDLTGQITLEEAVVLTTALNKNLTLNGEVELSEDRLNIEQLQGNVDEAEIAVTGVFPFFTPLESGNRLTAQLDQGQINLENLYEGRADANVTLQGMALNPIIGGEVRLYDGQVYIPQRTVATLSPAYKRWFGDFATLFGEPPVNVQLDNFQVILADNFRLVSSPVYKFSMTGDFTLTGSPLDIPSLRASGAIALDRGEITLFNTDLFLSRLNENQVVFDASKPLVNPNLDVEMGTTVSDATRIGAETSPNEIRDDVSRVGQTDTVTVNFGVQGQAEQLLTSLGAVTEANMCQRRPQDFFPEVATEELSTNNLEQEEQCLNQTVISSDNSSSQQILESQAVQLSSRPSRTRGEIIELLAQQFIGLAEQLENSTGEELLQFGVTEFIVEPLVRDIIFSVNEQATKVAQPIIGVDQALIYPELEGIYQLQEDAVLGVGYDYIFGEFKVRYERFF